MPKITILLPVHNAGSYLEGAIQSAMLQSVQDFKLIVLNDGSRDDTLKRVSRYTDPRIVVSSTERCIGVAATLNRGIELCTSEYIARLDADDRCRPKRLARQVAYMDANKDVVVCGTWARIVGAHGNPVFKKPYGGASASVFRFLDNPLIHPSVMIRASVLKDNDLRYDSTYSRSEDYDLWCRMSKYGRIDNIPEVLLDYSVHAGSVTATTSNEMERQTKMILRREMRGVGWDMSDEDLEFHRMVGHGATRMSVKDLARAEAWLLRFVDIDWKSHGYTKSDACAAAGFAWTNCCMSSARNGFSTLRLWRKSKLSAGYRASISETARMLIRSIIGMISG